MIKKNRLHSIGLNTQIKFEYYKRFKVLKNYKNKMIHISS